MEIILFLAALPLGHLKECEFRYNNRNENLTKVIKKLWEKHKKKLRDASQVPKF